VFYATFVDFCAKAIKVMDAPGKKFLSERNIGKADIHHSIGSTLAKALFRPFEKEFGDFETKLREQNEEIKEEITLAAEKAAAKEREDASKYRTSGLVFRSQLKQLSREAREKSLGEDKRRAGS
jgi:hypothetical protein